MATSPGCSLLRGGLVLKAQRLVYHSTLDWRVIKKKRRRCCLPSRGRVSAQLPSSPVR